ncbi:MAG TPA: chloride channel protein, partial [Polyangiaceae bacterium]|nr:chloride channel protein [Polyangiaceae bacterium]
MSPISFVRSLRRRLYRLARRPPRSYLALISNATAPIDLGIVSRTLIHAATVGIAAGLVGAAFFAGLEYTQRFLLEQLAGYVPLRADGETFAVGHGEPSFRPWLLLLLPGLGGLACGLTTRLAPETIGGGGDAMIDSFHHRGGFIRRRVIWVKALASMFTLGTGGAGGREGPIMQIGGALGSFAGRILGANARERRVLMVAGVAAGMAAVFRTPLGAALLAVEVLYRDGFESDSLVPSVLASVVSYSVIISIYGESTLFARVPRFPFEPRMLPLFGILAVCTAALSTGFVGVYGACKRSFAKLPVPDWARPAIGGLLLGAFATPLIFWGGLRLHAPGHGLGVLGGGYGAVQMAIAGSQLLSGGWTSVTLLVGLSFAKLLASSITIGSGGSAGDFAPSLAIGGLFGGAFGRAAQLLLHDPTIQPGAFALVGMGTFYGGIAHVPLSALVMVCELAGNYDLLVPLMLSLGIAFVALRNRTIYHSQVGTLQDSTHQRDASLLEALRAVQVRKVLHADTPPICFYRQTP